MPRYVAFLRAINVGGRIVKMDVLRSIFEGLGHREVSTFIASGNVLFEASARNTASLEAAIEKALETSLGYEVATFVRTRAEVAEIAEHQAFSPAETASAVALNVGLLKTPLDKAGVATLLSLGTEADAFHVNGREIYWRSALRQSESKFNNATFEKRVKTRATFRGLRTMQQLASKYPA